MPKFTVNKCIKYDNVLNDSVANLPTSETNERNPANKQEQFFPAATDMRHPQKLLKYIKYFMNRLN